MFQDIRVNKIVFVYPKWIRKFELREYARNLEFEWDTATEDDIKYLRNDSRAKLDFLGVVPRLQLSAFRAVAHFIDDKNIYFQLLSAKRKKGEQENLDENIPDQYFSISLTDFNKLQKAGDITIEQIVFLNRKDED
ncbi:MULTISPECIES: hypothetical protein [Bacteria]|uniref:Uncharacterized protein n=2 Tax=Enterococcus casseliflavus TaxID=37734 RepID=A0A6N2YEI1_ENTCA|nr:hypothetical protein [Enterococcus casseliflavus]MEB8400734.1 hypothetical protein [Enterococcus casseliflavus]NKD39301.1 hypothetical protein [Enterococcus casseliflavus]